MGDAKEDEDEPLNISIGTKDLAWDKDDLIEMQETHSGIVKQANGHIYDYDMDSVLRLGFFRIISPVLQVWCCVTLILSLRSCRWCCWCCARALTPRSWRS